MASYNQERCLQTTTIIAVFHLSSGSSHGTSGAPRQRSSTARSRASRSNRGSKLRAAPQRSSAPQAEPSYDGSGPRNWRRDGLQHVGDELANSGGLQGAGAEATVSGPIAARGSRAARASPYAGDGSYPGLDSSGGMGGKLGTAIGLLPDARDTAEGEDIQRDIVASQVSLECNWLNSECLAVQFQCAHG